MKISLRAKLIFYFVVVILIVGLISAWVGVHFIGNTIISQAKSNVRLDLNSAREIYQKNLDRIQDLVRLTAVRYFLVQSICNGDLDVVKKELGRIKTEESLDIFTLTDRHGVVLFRSANPPLWGDDQKGDEIVAKVLQQKKMIAATTIAREKELAKEGKKLVEQALIHIVPTPKARSETEDEETSGLMLKAAAPVLDEQGELVGVLYGGKLINRNYEIVDKIRDTVYRGEIYKGEEIGRSTIFKQDIRISTNVLMDDSSRAIGTRVSKEVYDQVIGRGLPWIERAFVVKKWYFTAYEPIRSISGDIIGILSVGIVEDKFTDLRRATVLVFLGIALAGIIVATIISCFLSHRILKPIKRLVSASQNLAQGDWEQKVRIGSNDEIGQLGVTFNFMADSLKDREEELKERAQQTIMESERLATIGQLAAGVAHELNNPLGGILLFSNLLLEKAPQGDPIRADLQRIVNETERCQKIVAGLLEFSRQTRLEVAAVDLNQLLKNTLDLVVNQKIFHDIKIVKKLNHVLPKVIVDVGQIQQVFINIILNAAEAMDGSGRLTVSTSVGGEKYVEALFEDTGPGISPEIEKKIFDPFFTTKPRGKGTGLGLSIAYGIVRKHNGSIKVKSRTGKGCIFKIKLPVITINDS